MRKAAEDELTHPTEAGMSRGTVQQIAADVGIAAERVERAARQLEARRTLAPSADFGSGAFWLGSPTTIASERIVDGEVSESAHEDIVGEVQATLSTEGHVGTHGESLTWRPEKPVLGKTRAVQVRVTSRGGQTRVRVEERLGELAVSLFSSISGGGGIGGLAVLLSLGGPALGWLLAGLLGAGWVGAMHALPRVIFRGVARGKLTDLEGLSRRLAEIASESARGHVEGGRGHATQAGRDSAGS